MTERQLNPAFILRSSIPGYNWRMLKQDNIVNRPSGRCRCRGMAAGALLALCLVMGSGASMASEDHDRARQAVEAGEVLPLRSILERVERDYPGQVVDVELERERESSQERWIYKIKLLRSGGALMKLKVDARDGSIIGKKAAGGHEREREQQRNRRGGEDH
ncbi:MAG: PepSY domain-containing protein [Candidatus Accumulibacter necessarius]|uniref:PepSY domain-containing protein n=1 Tax=Candidatus Accumulibacter necessarius TaxID=2954386 RepID=UPI002FC28019